MQIQLTAELVFTGIYVGAMAIGLIWVLFRAIRYARHVRAQNAAEALWMQSFAVQGLTTEQPATSENLEQNCTAFDNADTPNAQPDGSPQGEQ